MNRIESINSNPRQNLAVVLDDGSKITLTIHYSTNQRGWYYEISYGDKILNNRRIVTSPNMLRQFRNILPFGLACSTKDGYEPVFIDDFNNERASLYILNEEDVISVEEFLTSV